MHIDAYYCNIWRGTLYAFRTARLKALVCVIWDRSHPTHVKTAPQCWWPICSTAIQYALLTRALQCRAQCGVFKCDECGMQCVDAVWRPRMRGQLAWRQIRQYRVTLGGRSWYDETLFSSSKATRTHQSTSSSLSFSSDHVVDLHLLLIELPTLFIRSFGEL